MLKQAKDWKAVDRVISLYCNLDYGRRRRSHRLVQSIQVARDTNKVVMRADGVLPIDRAPAGDIVSFFLSLLENQSQVKFEIPIIPRALLSHY